MAYMLNNIPKYTTDVIDSIAIDAIETLMYRLCCDILADLDMDVNITPEGRKRNITEVLRLIENLPSMPTLDFISQAHVLFITKVIMNYSVIKDVLIPFHNMLHYAPNIQNPPFSELVTGKLLSPVKDVDEFKEYTIKLVQLIRSRFPIMMSELYENNEVINKYNLNRKDFRDLQPSKKRKKNRSLSV